MFSLTRLQRYAISVAGVILTAVLRLALDPILGEDLPLFLFVFPITFAAWWGGLWPGILATALSTLLGDYLFIAPRGSLFHSEHQLNLIRALALASGGTGVSILFDRIRKIQRFAQHIVDVSPSVICIYDVRQQKSVFVNREIATALGYSLGPSPVDEEFIHSLIHPDDWPS